MTLEFRNKDGRGMFKIIDENLCFGILYNIAKTHELEKTTESLGNEKDGFNDYVVYTCTRPFSCKYAGTIDINFCEGDYIKIIN